MTQIYPRTGRSLRAICASREEEPERDTHATSTALRSAHCTKQQVTDWTAKKVCIEGGGGGVLPGSSAKSFRGVCRGPAPCTRADERGRSHPHHTRPDKPGCGKKKHASKEFDDEPVITRGAGGGRR